MFKKFVNDLVEANTEEQINDVLYGENGVDIAFYSEGTITADEHDVLFNLACRISELFSVSFKEEVKMEKAVEIKENRKWTISSVRKVCCDNNLYTLGDNEEYEHMFSWVKRLYPNAENIYFIANDICKHSEDQTVCNIMFLLENYAVIKTFEINGRDDM